MSIAFKPSVVYKNEMNLVPMRRFNAAELNLFFSICSRMKNKGVQEIRFGFEDLKELSNYKPTANARFVGDLKSTYQKMLQLTYGKEEGLNSEYFVLFTGFKIDAQNRCVDIKVNPDLEPLINELTGNFTKFELREFTHLKSSYSKNLYRLLKQYRKTGFYKVSVIDFRHLMDIPESYQMCDLDKQVFKLVLKELGTCFYGLSLEKIKAIKGRKIEFFVFRFKGQDDVQEDGIAIFRDENGTYYEKDIEHFSKAERKKAFPEIKE